MKRHAEWLKASYVQRATALKLLADKTDDAEARQVLLACARDYELMAKGKKPDAQPERNRKK